AVMGNALGDRLRRREVMKSRRLTRPPPIYANARVSDIVYHTKAIAASQCAQVRDVGSAWPCQNAGGGRTSRTPFFSGHHVLPSYGKPARKPRHRKNKIPLRGRPFGVFTQPGSSSDEVWAPDQARPLVSSSLTS